MRLTRSSIGAFLAALMLVVGMTPGAFAASEDTLLSKLNSERTSRGLAALSSHWDLADDAEAHSVRMMGANDLHHNPNLSSVTTGWAALGENVGLGPSANSIHSAFMDSAAHRGNILGDFTHVGVGAVRESDNKLWVTVVFMKAKRGATTTTTTAPPTTTTTTGPSSPPTSTSTPAVTTTSASPGSPPATIVVAARTEPAPTAEPVLRFHLVRLRHQPWPD